MKTRKCIHAFISIILCEIVGVLGSIAVISSITGWYNRLNKPSFAPPNWIFGPVWIALYTLIGISAYLVWDEGKGRKITRPALNMFTVQLVLNALWPTLFFGLRSTLYGLIDILALWLTMVVTMLRFYRISRRAAALFAPYVLWVTFAAILNVYIWHLN